MKRHFSFNRFLIVVTFMLISTHGVLFAPITFAQEPVEEIVYFTDGSFARGHIVHINRKIIRIALTDGTIVDRPVTLLYRFYSKRPFIEIYNQSLETENLKFDKGFRD